MDVVDQLKQDVREGRISADRLLELVVTLQRELQAARQRIEEL
jgi:transposase